MQCRYCLNDRDTNFNIGSEITFENDTKTIQEMMGIFKLDELSSCFFAPKTVCLLCLQMIVNSYKFYQNCLASLDNFQLQSIESAKPIEPEEQNTREDILKQASTTVETSSLISVKCQKCLQEFKSKGAYIMHSKLHSDFICFYCYSGFLNETDMINHIQQVHRDQKSKCSICDSTFGQRKILNRHLKFVHKIENVPIFCGNCPKKTTIQYFTDKKSFENHLKQSHGSDFGVLDDMFDFDAEFLDEYLNEISKMKVKPISFDDEELQENFLRNFELTKTNPSKYNPKNKMILEEFLDEVLDDDEIWSKYLNDAEEYLLEDNYLDGNHTEARHNDVFRFKCPRCVEKYRKFADLKVHLAHLHNEFRLVCDDCGAVFNRKDEFINHRKAEHTRDDKLEMKGDFNCNLCDKKFMTINGLKHHLKAHTGVQATHMCPYCPKKFIANSNLIDHVKIHCLPSISCNIENCEKNSVIMIHFQNT